MNKAKRTSVLLVATLAYSAAVSGSMENATPLPVYAAASEQAEEKNETVHTIPLSSPQKDEEGNMLWDMVYFGNYWKNDTDHNGIADRRDEKEPVLWRVLSVTEDQKAILQSEYCLEKRRFNEDDTDVNWGTCTLRSWLNGYGSGENTDQIDYREDNFINEAFSKTEQELLVPVSLQTQKHPHYGTNCGEDTVDKVYLLAYEDIQNEAYGFKIDKLYNYANSTKSTVYCQDSRGLQHSSDPGIIWWLRTSGETNKKAMKAGSGNYISLGLSPGDEVWFDHGVRPVVCIDLKKTDTDFIKYAGKISSGLVKATKPVNKTQIPVMPVREGSSTTWDCINFGAYYQNDTNGDGKIDESDEMEPIKWRVLDISKDGKTVTLLSDKNLDKMYFNEISTEISWGTSACRSWLNGYDGQQNADAKDYSGRGFCNIAFSEKEREAIAETTLADVGTTDKVYLLSMGEVSAEKFGFEKDHKGDIKYSYSRTAENTTYVDIKVGGTKGWVGGDWFLRNVTDCNKWTATVSDSGIILNAVLGRHLCAVRPALRLNLEQAVADDGSLLWEHAGTVTTRKDNDEPFFVTSPTDAQPKKGDIDADGEITLEDAQLALRAALHLIAVSEEQIQAADLSGNGEITLKDARIILRTALNLE